MQPETIDTWRERALAAEAALRKIDASRDPANGNAPQWCGDCGAALEAVRPGKVQCPSCEERRHLRAAVRGWKDLVSPAPRPEKERTAGRRVPAALLSALGDTRWPPRDVLARLSTAAEHLLHDHDCGDSHGYEDVWSVIDSAREIIAEIDALRAIPEGDEGAIDDLVQWVSAEQSRCDREGSIFDTGFFSVSEGGTAWYFDPESITNLRMYSAHVSEKNLALERALGDLVGLVCWMRSYLAHEDVPLRLAVPAAGMVSRSDLLADATKACVSAEALLHSD